MRLSATTAFLLAFSLGGGAAFADTTDVTWQTRVVIEKEGDHCVDDPNCFNRYHPAIPSVATANPGDVIVLHTRDALDSDLTFDSNADDLAALDLNLVHPMTGPVAIEGAERGDVIAVTVMDIEPDQYGYTVIVPGFGFLRDLYTDPYLVNWRLSRLHAVSDQMPGVAVPYEAFTGSIGVLPGEEEVAIWLEREAALGCRRRRRAAAGADRRVAKRRLRSGRLACRHMPAHDPAAGRTAAIWTCSRCRSAPRSCCPALSTAAASSSATSITLRATAKCPARRSRWALW